MDLTREQLAALARLVAETAPSELDCGAVLDCLAALLEARQRGAALTHELGQVKQHLRVCPECLEEFEILEELYGHSPGETGP